MIRNRLEEEEEEVIKKYRFKKKDNQIWHKNKTKSNHKGWK
jgi:hypothetical protein